MQNFQNKWQSCDQKKLLNSHVPQLCANVNFIYIIDYDVISDSAKKRKHACVGKTKIIWSQLS